MPTFLFQWFSILINGPQFNIELMFYCVIVCMNVEGFTNPECFSSPMLGLSTSSDEDLDNDLRQGIDNIM